MVVQRRAKSLQYYSINFGPGYGTVLTQDIRATFTDKLGTIGGTFGIFVGISFLSMYEMLADSFDYLKSKMLKVHNIFRKL